MLRRQVASLAEVARDEPDQLTAILGERQGTIDSGITYLEDLASNYARLYPRLQRQPCDVEAIARQVVANAGSRGGLTIQTDLKAEGALVMGDPVALRRIIENLVDNAIDSLAAGRGSVTVATELENDGPGEKTVRISVSDTGCGLSEEHVSRIFDHFYTTKEGGTGLGLSIVRRLVLDLNGSIRVESAEGTGSCFVVELPAHSAGSGANEAGVKEGGQSQ